MQSRSARLATAALVSLLLAVTMVVTGIEAASAHTPHDVIADVVLSPKFATDQTVLTISDNRPLRSTDGGRHWVQMVRGLSGQTLAHYGISDDDPQVVYLSTRGGGILRSDDQGTTWAPASTLASMRYMSELAVSPVSSDIVVAAAGLLGGLFRTEDGGATWTKVPGIGKVNAVTFLPGASRTVVIGGQDGSIHVSKDNGATFTATGESEDGAPITSVGAAPKGANTLFVGTKTGALLRSETGGDSWSDFGSGIPGKQINSIAVSDDFAADSTAWASTWERGAYRSTDGGKTWKLWSRGLTSDHQADELELPQFQALAVAPGRSGEQALYLAGYDGLFATAESASRWEAIETVSEFVTGLAVSPDYAKDGTVVVNTYLKGVYISRDRGRRFVASNRGFEFPLGEGNKLLPVRRMHNVVFSPGFAEDQTIFTATWDKFARSTDAGRTWKTVIVSPPPPNTSLRQFVIGVSPAFVDDQTIYLGTRQGNVYRSTQGGVAGSWTEVAKLDSRVRSLVVSPGFATDRTLFASTVNGIVKSTDAGATWTATGPRGIALLAISPGFASDGTVFAGTEAGLYVTRDRGATWSNVGAAPLSPTSKVAALALSPDFPDDATVLVSVAGEGLFRSTDGGTTFSAVGRSLLDDSLIIGDFENPTSAPIQFSPAFATDRTVYAYAQQSVVRSTDAGDTWDVLHIPPAAAFAGAHLGSHPSSGSTEPDDGDDDGLPVLPIVLVGALVVVVAGFSVYRVRASRARRATGAGAGTGEPQA